MKSSVVKFVANVLGVDIGGTKIAAALIGENGQIIARNEVPSDATDKEKMFGQVVKSIEGVLSATNTPIEEVQSMGVGVAGKVDSKNGIAVYQNNLPWENFPLRNRLQQAFEIDQITIDNDVVMATFAEWQMVKEQEEETFVYLTVSTGISCSIIHNGEVLRGSGFSGELGLLPVVKAQSSVERLELLAAGPAIQKVGASVYQDENCQTKDVFLKYESGDLDAKRIVDEAIAAIAHGVYAVVCLLDPHKIVIGGGVFNHQPALLDLLKEALEKHLIKEQLDVLSRFSLSKLQGDAGIIGAGLKGKTACKLSFN